MAGELDNRTPGTVTGWMRFFRNGKPPLRVTFDLVGDFHEDIRGTAIRLSNPNPSDEYRDEGKTYMDGFSRMQRGTVGDITAGIALGPWTEHLARKLMEKNELYWDERNIRGSERERRRREFAERYRAHIAAGDVYYPYVEYSYIEWYAANGRVVLELDPSQVEIVGSVPPKEKTPAELSRRRKETRESLCFFFRRHGERSFQTEPRARRRRQRYRHRGLTRFGGRGSRLGGWAARMTDIELQIVRSLQSRVTTRCSKAGLPRVEQTLALFTN